jgi:hypothetical protein
MRDVIERKTVRFGAWMPTQRDNGISYSYVNPRDGRTVRVGADRWMRAKYRIAASALASGQTEFSVRGGLGRQRWVRVVTCTEEEAHAFFQDAINAGAFTLKGEYRRARTMAERRLRREGLRA